MVLVILIVVVCLVVLAGWYKFTDITEYDYICANCGSTRKSFNAPSDSHKDSCSACSHSQLVPVDTPRGRELMEMYHGSASAEERIRTAHEAAKNLVQRLEGAVPPSGIADELEKLARLVQVGALTVDEWERAKTAILGKPKDKQADAIERVAKLYRVHQTGALSQSEFNMTKWDILSRVGQA